jgi:hypothetical protein
MWWWIGAAWAGPLAGDPAAAWQGVRYLLQSEQRMPTTLVVPGHEPMPAEAVQLELLLACEQGGPHRADCAIRDAAVRAATHDLWQRPSDREEVDAVLAAVRAGLVDRVLEARFDARGDLSEADVEGIGAESHVLDLVESAAAALGGLGHPATPTDAVWSRPSHPLLQLAGVTSIRWGEVVHTGAWVDGHYVVETSGHGLPRAGFAETVMTAITAYDGTTGALEHRLYDVVQDTDPQRIHTGSARRLVPGETVQLGQTGQVAPPGEVHLGLPGWASMRQIAVAGAP